MGRTVVDLEKGLESILGPFSWIVAVRFECFAFILQHSFGIECFHHGGCIASLALQKWPASILNMAWRRADTYESCSKKEGRGIECSSVLLWNSLFRRNLWRVENFHPVTSMEVAGTPKRLVLGPMYCTCTYHVVSVCGFSFRQCISMVKIEPMITYDHAGHQKTVCNYALPRPPSRIC